MKKSMFLLLPVILAFASSANAVIVDSAAARVCLKGRAFGDSWDPNTSPHCVCGQGVGDKERVNLSVPGPKYKYAVAKYGDYRDRCAAVYEIKKAKPAPAPKRAPRIVVPPPTCTMSSQSIEAPADGEGSNTLICTGDVRRITKVVVTCNNCSASREEKALPGSDSYTSNIIVTGKPGVSDSQVDVTVLGKRGLNIPRAFTVVWKLSPCVFSGGTQAGNTCLCPDGKKPAKNRAGLPICVEKTPAEVACEATNGEMVNGVCTCPKGKEPGKDASGNAICVTPKKAPVKTKVVKGEKGDPGNPGTSASSRIHLLIEPKCLLVKSSSWKTSECFMSVGLTGDITDRLKAYVTVGLGTPGATLTDSAGTPVLKSNSDPDKRKLSVLIEGGTRIQLYKVLATRVGVFRRMDGETNGFSNPVHATTGGLLGLDVSFRAEGHTFGFGLAGTCGSHTKGTMPSDTECGVMFNAFFEGWTGAKY